jgi:RHH-type proline utilization regulon transcriptional repressor/proline dehydrogenase/delta 1-pyrroline-5-carboxylate dehydrogenase
MKFYHPDIASDPFYPAINAAYRIDEGEQVTMLLKEATLPAELRQRIADRARALVTDVRRQGLPSGIDGLMHEYDLSNQEGVVLMCLAEALLRIPDAETMDNLIYDKISAGDWEKHVGKSDSLFVNASSWGLMLTGRMIRFKDNQGTFKRFIQRRGEPVVRRAITQAMGVLGRQFIMGRTVKAALGRSRNDRKKGYRHSFDMLGEAARTVQAADRYFHAYQEAIDAIGEVAEQRGPIEGPGISVKLSALHPRYELAQGQRMKMELLPRLRTLALQAKSYNIGLNIDSEEATRIDLSLELLKALFTDPALEDWEGLGLALPAYQKRAFHIIDWLADLAHSQGRRLLVRLVKGAYWDAEIKRAQEQGLDGYPVFTRKASTDVSYLACARKLLATPDAFYPQFASHNAHTVAAVLEMAGERRDFEFQRLHGMGEPLYDQIVNPQGLNIPCRIYAPVGNHEDLLAYLVRRLLENGSNTSFVNRIVDRDAPIDEIIADPVAKVSALARIPHPRIPLPANLYGDQRPNSKGIDLSDLQQLKELAQGMEKAAEKTWWARPMLGDGVREGAGRGILSPADRRRQVGTVVEASDADVEQALAIASRAAPTWDATPVEIRAGCLERAADLMEEEMATLMGLCTLEAGKNIADGVAEVREAVDFCRYYANRARINMALPHSLPGPTGQRDQLSWRGRGVFVCISPWNFPLAIFLGQVSAALVTGNAVIAKPAEQTPLIAAYAVDLLHRAGVPRDVLQLLPGDGAIGARLVSDARVAGVAFTGSIEAAWSINRSLAAKSGPIAPLIAETGGQNVMIVDSSALPEQVVVDVLASSFQSAGQRCSALRVLYVQADIADNLLNMLTGAMVELRVGDPGDLATDVGPVIDTDALATLRRHAERLEQQGRLIYRCKLSSDTDHGSFFPPQAFEIESITQLEREVFGPILHVVRYRARDLDKVIDAINNTGYGLTFGIHSRIDSTIRYVTERIRAGNAYVNRNMIGAVVGVQPFGGEGLSGTGPKAGGPHYLYRFATEQALSVNTTAAGGNASLMSLQDDEL